MNILCPSCQRSIALADGERLLVCDRCQLTTPVSQLGTAPGVGMIPAVRDLSGETLDGYRIDELIGMGGMGIVYRARSPHSDDFVAVKVLNSDMRWKRDEFVARFEREVRTLSRLEHDNIVRILDHGETDGAHYLVTEYVSGDDLAQVLSGDRDDTEGDTGNGEPTARMDLQRALVIMLDVCAGIDHAHENGIVHRDLKPANIIVAKDGHVKVLDFGLAQVTDSQFSSLTRTDLAMGTFNYLSPEQRMSAKNVDRRADIYALGVIFYEMLTGTLPMGRFALPSAHDRALSTRVDHIVERALSPDPADRYQTVAHFAEALRALRPRARTSRRPLALAAALLITGLVGGVGFTVAGTDWLDSSEKQPGEKQPAATRAELAPDPKATDETGQPSVGQPDAPLATGDVPTDVTTPMMVPIAGGAAVGALSTDPVLDSTARGNPLAQPDAIDEVARMLDPAGSAPPSKRTIKGKTKRTRPGKKRKRKRPAP